MNETNFAAQNELETILLNLLNGGMEGEDFLSYLMDAQVYMPLHNETPAIKEFQHTAKPQPLLAEDEDGTQALILFTSQDRAKEFMQDYPGFNGGLLTEFIWVLRKMDTPINITLNPGYEAGFDMDADTVASLMAELPPESL